MSLNPTSPVTGAAISGLTSPTYTMTEDNADANSRRFMVTALGGTQTNVETHSASSPFTATVSRPQSLKTLPRANAVTGLIPAPPVNRYKIRFAKGVTIQGGTALALTETQSSIEVILNMPAGFELAANDIEDSKALFSFAIGFLSGNAQGLLDMAMTGLLK